MTVDPSAENTRVIGPNEPETTRVIGPHEVELEAAPRRRWAVTAGALVVVAMLATVAFALLGGFSADSAAHPVRAAAPAPEPPPVRPRPQVVRAVAPGEGGVSVSSDLENEPSAPATDDEVRRDVERLQAALKTGREVKGARARMDGRGDAMAPAGAPQVVAQVIEAGNLIARKPYVYGGGHGGWRDRGYDCSGSVSFALAGAGLLDRPLDSSGLMRWGSQRTGPLDHRVRQPGPRLHGRRWPALRHQRARRRRHALADRHARRWRIQRPPPRRPLRRPLSGGLRRGSA